MSAGRRYVLGLSGVGLVGALLAWRLGPELRDEVGFGVLIALVVQAPLGWWTLRSIGTQRFQLVWVTGMVVRLAVIAMAALVLAPEYGWNTAATLIALVATLLVLLLVEAVTALQEQSGIERR